MKLPIDRSGLRDQAVEARVDRIWERLEGRLHGEVGHTPRSATKLTHARTMLGVAAGFALGLGVSRWPSPGDTRAERAPLAERPATATEAAPTTRIEDETAGEQPPVRREPRVERERESTPRGARVVPEGGRPPAREGNPEPTPAVSAWAAACSSFDYAKAFELLRAQGNVAAVLQQATNEQRLCIANGSRQHDQADIAKLALQRVVDDSDDADRGAIAAAQLARIYEEEGDVVEQRRFEQLKEIRSKGRLLSESALCEKIQVQAGVGAHRSVLELAQQYENQYPSGTCSATVEALVATAKAKLAEAPAEPQSEPEAPSLG
ncbi:MAG: hypothetical protein FJ096_14250, partial [Deltaproteobacteria bacterium]|nr:hypothetical protein [Deltaproteobacteria bacterium]